MEGVSAFQVDAVCRVVHGFHADDTDATGLQHVVVDTTDPYFSVLIVGFGVVGASAVLSGLDGALEVLLVFCDVAVVDCRMLDGFRLDS